MCEKHLSERKTVIKSMKAPGNLYKDDSTFIVTRNIKDFAKAAVPVCTQAEFLDTLSASGEGEGLNR